MGDSACQVGSLAMLWAAGGVVCKATGQTLLKPLLSISLRWELALEVSGRYTSCTAVPQGLVIIVRKTVVVLVMVAERVSLTCALAQAIQDKSNTSPIFHPADGDSNLGEVAL